MNSQFVANEPDRRTSLLDVLKRLLHNASRLDIAVSYVQMSGWTLIEELIEDIQPENVRLLFTDQFGLTHPEALRRALRRGVEVRNYSGNRVYHPKVYLVYGQRGRPTSALVGSANLSESGLVTGVEAGGVLSERRVLSDLRNWFQQRFDDKLHTSAVDDALLETIERTWISAAARRVEAQRKKTQNLLQLSGTPPPEDLNTLEDLFSTIRLPIGILSIDHAANNIRNLARLMEVLRRWPKVSAKERSERRLLGFATADSLTRLGGNARNCRTHKALAETWCRWAFE